jgi:hypothetical protein
MFCSISGSFDLTNLPNLNMIYRNNHIKQV